MDRLKALGFAEETSASAGSVDNRGFEVARRDTRLTAEGKQIAGAKCESLSKQERDQIVTALEVFKRGGDVDYMELSIAAKTLFMLRDRKAPANEKDLAALAPKFGWEVTPEQVRTAFDYLKSLGLSGVGQES